ncbi:RNA polymerase II transcriptional coactivator [Coelomomyces lativittatus]|nr:RNA polymerase II transcriptional coactivator [Coelomomyces lativittatus]
MSQQRTSSENKKRMGDDDVIEPLSPKKKRTDSLGKNEKLDTTSSHLNTSNPENDELTYDLGNKKKVSIKAFKNKVYIHVREFYEKEGDLLPGKKGISLTLDQWKRLEGLVKTISKEAASLQAQFE